MILLGGVHTLEHYEGLSFLVYLVRLAELHISRVSNLANLDTALVQPRRPIVRKFFLRNKLLLVSDIIVDLDVFGTLDVKRVRTVEVVDFLLVLFTHLLSLETKMFLLTVFLNS